jgi:anaerobic magnesium-protoporphyrin IX monomethyl ester cyclase
VREDPSCYNEIYMSTHPVILIAYEDFDNLGVGYMVSVLSESGFESQIIDFQSGKENILKTLKKAKPLLVGFSLIFQYHIYEFQELIDYLRKGGVKCHFTAGGHYASLRFGDLFKLIPSLDSIVRFDGEYTLLELVNCIQSGADWRKVKSIAYRNNDKIKVNPLRPTENDLDKLPFPARPKIREYAFDKKFATIIAARGCVNNCSFCNAREYYMQSSGPYKRLRNPENVVGELEFLYHEKGCSVFLFEDDDFPVKTDKGSEWIERFCKELKGKNLHDKIMWKINCRPDEIDYDSFAMMKSHGLFLVFLGIDDGTDSGLIRLNKHMTVQKSLEGTDILKSLEIGFDYGFMLFQPSSTFRSVNDNFDFLKRICGDGYTPLIFLKLVPYFGTRIEKELMRQGRLKGKPGFLDYDFLDISLNHYYMFVTDCLMEWFRDSDGLVNMSRWARNYVSVFSHYNETTPGLSAISNNIKRVISDSNLFLLDTLKELSSIFESGKYDPVKFNDLNGYSKSINLNHDIYKEQILNSINKIYYLVVRQKVSHLIDH